MNTIIWGMALAVVFLFLVLFVYSRRELKKRNMKIHELQESVNSLQMQLENKEKRKTFRVKLLKQKCTFTITDFGDPKFEILKNKKSEGEIIDVSSTGMKISCPLDLPIKKKVIFQLDFTLQEEPFSFKGKIIRKEETIEDTIYAIRFINAENPS